MTADQRERQALDEAKDQLRRGWQPEEIVVVLADAEKIIADLRRNATQVCAWCDELITGEYYRDAVAVSWIGDGANIYCSRTCMWNHSQHRINAAGNEPS